MAVFLNMTKAESPIAEIALKEVNIGVNRLWGHFEDFTHIPRKTGNEDAMRDHVLHWAIEHNLQEWEVDNRGNVLIVIPATDGLDNAPGIILQGHLDMVCVGEPDPAIYGVTPKLSEDGEWLTANGTSAGFDNGIGDATIMALAESNNPHGPLALMFTVNEEVGIEGALNMGFSYPLDRFQYLINLDSEEEGEATISSAGGGDTLINLPLENESLGDRQLLTLSLEGLMGGHSGIEIGEDRLNAIKVIGAILADLTAKTAGINLVNMDFGYARNVIPSKGKVTIAVEPQDVKAITKFIARARETVLGFSVHDEEQALKIEVKDTDQKTDSVMTRETSFNVIKLLSDLPHGVDTWSGDVDGLVQTSTNLAVAKTEGNELKIQMMTRSSVDDELAALRNKIGESAENLGAQVKQLPPYPGWPARPESAINSIAGEQWLAIAEEELKIIAVHAGLECGAIMGKYPNLEAISIGPEIKGAHSTEERVNIASVAKFYRLVENMVKSIASLKI